jgi:protease-4
VTYVNLSYPEHKSIFSEYRELTPTERAKAESWLKTLYERLVSDIALNRNMTVEELTPYANGSIFTGYEAIEYGLIDELGGFNEALNKTITLANITEPLIIKSKETINLLDLISGISNEKTISLSI